MKRELRDEKINDMSVYEFNIESREDVEKMYEHSMLMYKKGCRATQRLKVTSVLCMPFAAFNVLFSAVELVKFISVGILILNGYMLGISKGMEEKDDKFYNDVTCMKNMILRNMDKLEEAKKMGNEKQEN